MAKLIIKLITAVGEVVNRDPAVRDRLKVVFLPELQRHATASTIYPAADLSEQISTAGKEASGTGNMKFAMNGALTIGTLDGANIEIREEVGAENFFLFGLTAAEVQAAAAPRATGRMDYYHGNPELRAVLDLIGDGFFSRGDGSCSGRWWTTCCYHDPYLVLADFQSYVDCQDDGQRCLPRRRALDAHVDPEHARARASSPPTARIREYCEEIWQRRAGADPAARAAGRAVRLHAVGGPAVPARRQRGEQVLRHVDVDLGVGYGQAQHAVGIAAQQAPRALVTAQRGQCREAPAREDRRYADIPA